MIILAVDPGGTTGFATWDYDETRVPEEQFAAWDDPDRFNAIETVRERIVTGVEIVVCESFQLSMNTLKKSTAGSLETIEMIGALRWVCHKRGVEFVTQKPSDAAGFSTPEKLKAIGWWTPGSDHARSATKHLILYLAANRLIDPSRLIP